MCPGQFREREIFLETGLPVRDCEPCTRIARRRPPGGDLSLTDSLQTNLAQTASPSTAHTLPSVIYPLTKT